MGILNSWKEIAAYLGRGVRTVQRWERDLGLPVHRPKGRQRSAVLAFPAEVDEWLRRTPVRQQVSAGNGTNRFGNGEEHKHTDWQLVPTEMNSSELRLLPERIKEQLDSLQRALADARQLRAALHQAIEYHRAAASRLHVMAQRVSIPACPATRENVQRTA